MNWTGGWASTKTYLPGQIVVINNVAYKCIMAHVNSVPPSNKWSVTSGWLDNTQTFVSGAVISAGSPVTLDVSGKLELATSNVPIGITVQDMSINDSGSVVVCGAVTNGAWAFEADLPVFVTSSGTLTQVAPNDVLREIGIALSATSILINQQSPIVLG